jgi:hypothetical protein
MFADAKIPVHVVLAKMTLSEIVLLPACSVWRDRANSSLVSKIGATRTAVHMKKPAATPSMPD